MNEGHYKTAVRGRGKQRKHCANTVIRGFHEDYKMEVPPPSFHFIANHVIIFVKTILKVAMDI